MISLPWSPYLKINDQDFIVENFLKLLFLNIVILNREVVMKLAGKEFVVVGGGGLIGSHTVDLLCKRRYIRGHCL